MCCASSVVRRVLRFVVRVDVCGVSCFCLVCVVRCVLHVERCLLCDACCVLCIVHYVLCDMCAVGVISGALSVARCVF